MGLRLGLAEVSTTYTTAEVGDGAGVPFFFFFFFFLLFSQSSHQKVDADFQEIQKTTLATMRSALACDNQRRGGGV